MRGRAAAPGGSPAHALAHPRPATPPPTALREIAGDPPGAVARPAVPPRPRFAFPYGFVPAAFHGADRVTLASLRVSASSLVQVARRVLSRALCPASRRSCA